jgi:hypothetical protein
MKAAMKAASQLVSKQTQVRTFFLTGTFET